MMPVKNLTRRQTDDLLAGCAPPDIAALREAVALADLLNRAYRLGQEAAGAVSVAEVISRRRAAMVAAMTRAYAQSAKKTWDRTMVEVVMAAFDACAEPDDDADEPGETGGAGR